MDRRLMLLGLAAGASVAATAIPGLAFAKEGHAEMEHGAATAMAGHASLEMARVGLEKASDPKVKEFARFEVDEQETIAEVLKAAMPGMPAPKLDQKDAATLTELKGMKSGAEFDKAFVKAQTEGHEKLLRIQDTYLKGGNDVPTVNVTKLARGMIKEHLTILGDLAKMG